MTYEDVFKTSQLPYKRKYGRLEWLLAPMDWHWTEGAELLGQVACGWAMLAGMIDSGSSGGSVEASKPNMGGFE